MSRPRPRTGPGATAPSTPGPAVVVDIDGVLSDAASRQHYLESPRRDWRAFFDACGDDPVIEEVKVLLDLLDADLRIVLLTARPERIHHLTEAWLHHYRIRWDVLIMRGWGDYEVSRDFKQMTVCELRRYGFELKLAFEDDRRNVEMFRARASPASTCTPATTTDAWTRAPGRRDAPGVGLGGSLHAGWNSPRIKTQRRLGSSTGVGPVRHGRPAASSPGARCVRAAPSREPTTRCRSWSRRASCTSATSARSCAPTTTATSRSRTRWPAAAVRSSPRSAASSSCRTTSRGSSGWRSRSSSAVWPRSSGPARRGSRSSGPG